LTPRDNQTDTHLLRTTINVAIITSAATLNSHPDCRALLIQIVAPHGSAAGKKPPVVVAAIAREMAAFLWAIGREVAPL
jgi:hypothetical protein